MATETGSDNGAASKPKTTNFMFRPSALSEVADKIWKNTQPTTSIKSDNGECTKNLMETSNVFGRAGLLSAGKAPTPSFIFGQNISQRVINATLKENSSDSQNQGTDGEDGANSKTVSKPVGFDDVANITNKEEDSGENAEESSASEPDKTMKTSLEQAAAAYQASQNQSKLQLLHPDDVKTGEEDEVNLAQSSVKLHVFNATEQTWTDRGLANFRINDKLSDDASEPETRIVIRLQGSLRVIFNTKLWLDMVLERASPKRLRLSGTMVEDCGKNCDDSTQTPPVAIYLISASQADIDRIERVLRDRLEQLKSLRQEDNDRKRKLETSYEEHGVTSDDADEICPTKRRQPDV